MPSSEYISPKIRLRETGIGKGNFAVERIAQDELVSASRFQGGEYLSAREVSRHPRKGSPYIFQIDDDLFSVPTGEPAQNDFINHSCDPNCGLRGIWDIVAMRAIEPDEEITIDYAMSESHYRWRLECRCGKPNCRRILTGNDWLNPELQRRYRGYFSAYLQKKIDGPPLQKAWMALFELPVRRARWALYRACRFIPARLDLSRHDARQDRS